MNESLGDRMKIYESMESDRRSLPLLPILARLDGKGFSRFTRDLTKPFDERLSRLMIETTIFMARETNALCGYTQSDEITLLWHYDDPDKTPMFDGRWQKMVSVLAATCSVRFNRMLAEAIPEKRESEAIFDCRMWTVPTLEEATNVFLWRERDATKNSISMAASAYYSHRELDGKSGSEKQELLWRKGINWNDYPAFFKRGSYIQRRRVIRKLTVEELDDLPPQHHARTNPDLEIERAEYRRIEMPPLEKVTNRVGVIFRGEEPAVNSG